MDIIIFIIITIIIILLLYIYKPYSLQENKKLSFIKLSIFAIIFSYIIFMIMFGFLEFDCKQTIHY